MQLPLLTFSTLLQRMAASLQGLATPLIDLSIGSVLRACLEASAAIALWLQWLILQVLALTRAATSAGADLDSWMNDFSLLRLPGTAASGIVTFARYTPGIQAFIPVGTLVRTFDGTQSFAVLAQSTNPAWNGSNGYVIGASYTSVDLPVAALITGSAGNVSAGAVGLLAAAISGIDTVSNSLAFVGGIDAESDAALRARFRLYINSRSLATATAIQYAATVGQGLRLAVLENQDLSGVFQPGNFVVVVDDGTGSPPDALVAAAQAAVEQVRPIGSTYSVSGPSTVPVSVQMTILTSDPVRHSAVAGLVQAAVSSWIAGLPIAGTLAISKLDALAHDADPSVQSVAQTTINGVTLDVTAPARGVLLPVSVAVS